MGIIHRIQDWCRFGEKNAPRGTLLWNDNPRVLVYVDNFIYLPGKICTQLPLKALIAVLFTKKQCRWRPSFSTLSSYPWYAESIFMFPTDPIFGEWI